MVHVFPGARIKDRDLARNMTAFNPGCYVFEHGKGLFQIRAAPGGIIGDLVVGVIGSLLGGWLFGLLGIAVGGLIGSLITAFVGAIVLIFLLRLIKRG